MGLKALMHGCIKLYGRTDCKTVMASQRLDKLIVSQQRELMNK